jgi:biopolymer transport protein ExbB
MDFFAAADSTAQINLLSMATKGGVLMAILAVISIVAIAIIIERLIKLKRARINEAEFLNEISVYLKEKNFERAMQLCEENPDSPVANVIVKLLENSRRGVANTTEIIDLAISKEIHSLEKHLGTISTFAAIAPLIGFLGTVTGMVKVFMRIGETGGGVDISLLANGIWEALITTIGGLSVGIITILFYNHLVGKVEDIAHKLEEDVSEFLIDVRSGKSGNQ